MYGTCAGATTLISCHLHILQCYDFVSNEQFSQQQIPPRCLCRPRRAPGSRGFGAAIALSHQSDGAGGARAAVVIAVAVGTVCRAVLAGATGRHCRIPWRRDLAMAAAVGLEPVSGAPVVVGGKHPGSRDCADRAGCAGTIPADQENPSQTENPQPAATSAAHRPVSGQPGMPANLWPVRAAALCPADWPAAVAGAVNQTAGSSAGA